MTVALPDASSGRSDGGGGVAAPGRGHGGASVLVIEDTRTVATVLRAQLERDGYRVRVAATGGEALRELGSDPPDLLLLDLGLPDIDGHRVLEEVNRLGLACGVVVVTGDGSLQTAVEAMRAGAYDFLVKPVSAERLRTTARNALEHARLRSRVELLEQGVAAAAAAGAAAGRDRFCGLIGASPAMQAVYRAIETAAPSIATAFVTGESGTGKELAAEALHLMGPRGARPFVALNCAAIPKDLIESEVFGHVRGGFTGAVADRPGAARQADGGTLFLDEVCELPLELQGKLLRFLQTGMVQPVGGSRAERVDIRVVCATNRDPRAEVRAGRFRQDLFYRLHVIPIRLPPLRERGRDALLIGRELLRRYAREEGRRFADLAPDAEAALLAHDWPGNVRELQNVLRRAVVMHDGERLLARMLPPLEATAAPAEAAAEDLPAAADGAGGRVGGRAGWRGERDIVPLAEVEREAIERAIELCGGNVVRAAVFLGVSPSTLYRRRQGGGPPRAVARGGVDAAVGNESGSRERSAGAPG